MRFMAPHGTFRRARRNLVLRMAPRSAWFRRRVDSGRLAEPARYGPSAIVAPAHGLSGLPRHGAPAPDVPLAEGDRLRDRLGGSHVVVSPFEADRPADLPPIVIGPDTVYGADRAWLVRPDGHLADSVPRAHIDALAPGLSTSDDSTG